MAAVGARVRVPVAVACRILGFSKQGYFKWLKQPVSAREAEEQELISVLHQLHNDERVPIPVAPLPQGAEA
ncbi:hypothetical protein TESS_TESS_00876 [Tessaracoccus sp. O5.2]